MQDADAKTPFAFGPDDLEFHARFVRRLAHALLQTADADDVAQEALLASMRRPGARTNGWFAIVVRRLAGRLRRANRRRGDRERRVARAEVVSPIETAGAEAEILRRLGEALVALPTPMRDLVVAVYFHGRRPSEIAAAEGINAATVRSRLKRAIDHLREDLDERPGRARWEAALAPLAAPSLSLLPFVGGGLILVAVAALIVVRGCNSESDNPDDSRLETAPMEAPRSESDAPEPRRDAAPLTARPATDTAASHPVEVLSESRPTGDLVVTVVRASDKAPLSGIDLRIEDPAEPEGRVRGRPRVSDVDGRVRFAGLRQGRLWAISNRGPGIRVRIEPGLTVHETLEIDARYSVRGLVLDESGRPVAGADILLGHARDREWWAPAAKSDAAGRFRLSALEVHQLVAVTADGFRPSRVFTPDRRQSLEREPEESVFVLEHGAATVEGRVVDRDGRRLAGVEVRIGSEQALPSFDSEGRPLQALGVAHFVTAADGSFRSNRLTPGMQPIAARSRGFGLHRGTVEPKPGGVETIEIVMQPEAIVFGRAAFESGDPAADRFIAVRGDDAFCAPFAATDEHGRFLLRGLASGRSTLVVQASDGAAARTTIDLRPGDRVEWNPVLATGLSISGFVVDDDGRPIDAALVRLVPAGGTDASTADLLSRDGASDAKGAYRFNGLQDRRYDLFVFRARGAMPCATLTGLRPTVSDLRVVCAAGATTGTLSGVVIGRDHAPVAGAYLRVFENVPGLDFTTETSAAGRFRFEGVAPGVAALVLRIGDRPEKLMNFGALRAGEDRELDAFIVPDPAFIEVRFSDGAARDRALGHVEIRETSGDVIWVKRQTTETSVIFGPLNPGEIRLGLGSSAKDQHVIALEVAEGETAVVDGARFLP